MKRNRFLLRETGNSKMRKVFLFLAALAVCFCMAGEAMGQTVDSGTTSGGCTWTLTGTSGNYMLTISGNGAMGDYDYDSSYSPWYSYRSGIKTVDIQQGVTSIGTYAFWSCTGLTSVMIPNSVTAIRNFAFYSCSHLTTVNFNAVNCAEIGEGVFGGCAVTSLNIGNEVTTIPDYAFSHLALTSVTIPNSVTSIGEWAFSRCTDLTTVNFNAVNCTTMGKPSYSVFSGCTAFTTLNIGSEVETIPAIAFLGCTSLTSVTIPNSVKSIGSSAFSGCSGLKHIYSLAANPPVAYNNSTFQGVTENCILHVPAGVDSKNKYAAADGWKEFYIDNIWEDAAIKLVAQPLPFYGGLIDGSLEYNYGDNAALTAESSSGYVFQHWMEDNTIVGTSATYTFAVTAPRTLYAVFAPLENENTVSIVPQPTEVSIEWESEAGAGSYTLVIYIDAARTQIHITLRFDANGTLQPVGAVNFSPAQRSAQNRLSYTVDGLQAGKEYYYSLTSYNAEEYALTTAVGSFETAIALGIDSAESREIRLYPNPVRESFRIAGLTAPTQVTVTNTAGQTVGQQIVSGDESISVRHLPQGVYLVRANGKTEKIIKN